MDHSQRIFARFEVSTNPGQDQFVGHRAGKLLEPRLTARVAAVLFAAVGAALVADIL